MRPAFLNEAAVPSIPPIAGNQAMLWASSACCRFVAWLIDLAPSDVWVTLPWGLISRLADHAPLENLLHLYSKMAAQVAQGHADDSGFVAQKYLVVALPTFVIIDGRQNVIAGRTGVIDWLSDEVQQAMLDLLCR